jgi:hypothetical protein
MEAADTWWKVATSSSSLIPGERLHTCIEGRYISVFRHTDGTLGSIDSTCTDFSSNIYLN